MTLPETHRTVKTGGFTLSGALKIVEKRLEEKRRESASAASLTSAQVLAQEIRPHLASLAGYAGQKARQAMTTLVPRATQRQMHRHPWGGLITVAGAALLLGHFLGDFKRTRKEHT